MLRFVDLMTICRRFQSLIFLTTILACNTPCNSGGDMGLALSTWKSLVSNCSWQHPAEQWQHSHWDSWHHHTELGFSEQESWDQLLELLSLHLTVKVKCWPIANFCTMARCAKYPHLWRGKKSDKLQYWTLLAIRDNNTIVKQTTVLAIWDETVLVTY